MYAMSDALILGLGALFTAMVVPAGAYALASLTGKQRKAEREQDHAWQIEANTKLDAVAASQEVTHAFLNSAETASMERERVLISAQRVSLALSLRLLRRLQATDTPTGDADEIEAAKIEEQIAILDTRTEVLQADIDRRLAAQHLAEAQVKSKP